MVISDIADFNAKCSHMRFNPCGYTENGGIRFLAVYHKKGKNIVLASFLCNPDTEHVDEIHFTAKNCNTVERRLKAISICLNTCDWTIDENTVFFSSIRTSKFNPTIGRFEKTYKLQKINDIHVM